MTQPQAERDTAPEANLTVETWSGYTVGQTEPRDLWELVNEGTCQIAPPQSPDNSISALVDTIDVLAAAQLLIQASRDLLKSTGRCGGQTALIAAANLNFGREYHHNEQETSKEHYVCVAAKEDDMPIVIDTGASFSVSPRREDFITPLEPSDVLSLRGLNGAVKVFGTGLVEWEVQDARGTVRKLRTKAYYVPSGNVRLFSPQVYFQANPNSTMTVSHGGLTLITADGVDLHFPFQADSNLPLMLTRQCLAKQIRKRALISCGMQLSDVFGMADEASDAAYLTTWDDSNRNLSAAQRELLLWHQRFGHADMSLVQRLLAQPKDEHTKRIIVPRHLGASSCGTPCCEACQYGKQKRRQPKPTTAAKHDYGGLSSNITIPGQRVSMDQYLSTVPGRLPNTQGKEKKEHKYCGGTIFIDHATKYCRAFHQSALTAEATLLSKHRFENDLSEFGIRIRGYLGDNHPFRSASFKADCTNQQQEIRYSGVGAHHQNGIAERQIQTIMGWSRTMLIHLSLHWPEAAALDLWPFAVDHAVWLWNHLPDKATRLSPLEKLTGTAFHNYHHLERLHVFGCPTYVLDPTLQDGKKLPKWTRRSRRGLHLGYSPEHSTTVSRVLNLETGNITPQYHCVHDDTFSSVLADSDAPFDATEWNPLLVIGHERYWNPVESETDVRNAAGIPPDAFSEPTWAPSPPSLQDAPRVRTAPFTPAVRETIPNEVAPITNDVANTTSLNPHGPQQELLGTPPVNANEGAKPSVEPSSSTPTPLQTAPQLQPPPPTELRRSARIAHRLQKSTAPGPSAMLSRQLLFPRAARSPKVGRDHLDRQHIMTLDWGKLLSLCKTGTLGAFATAIQRESTDGYVNYMDPSLLATMANSEDHPTWDEAMNGPDAQGYWEAATKEVRTLEDMDVWEEVDRQSWMKVISTVWAFRCKRFPDGLIRKLKGRFCARGFEVPPEEYGETYCPVVSWHTVRLLLIMSQVLGLATQQVDYVNAFVQSSIGDQEVYIEMPRGFRKPGKVLKLKKTLYGLNVGPRNFYNHLKSNLEHPTLGFVQSDADQCLFISDKVIVLVYVDDTLLFARNQSDIEEVITKLRELGMLLEKEDNVAGFLGVHIERSNDGTIHLTQKGLIKRIIDALNVEQLSPTRIPAKRGVLPKDTDGDPPNGTFNYASVVGMLQYLQAHSRPDITFAVSQCARYTFSPKQSHEEALVRIGRYLKGTQDKGILFKPQTDITNGIEIDTYVDADFAGGWGYEDPNDPVSVKSRTGFVIFIMGCPLVWQSKLQDCIATSTQESEYSALSMALRSTIPLLDLCKATMLGLKESTNQTIKFRTTVHEDNQGCLKLAQMEPGRSTPRSKFYALKMHWFRSWIKARQVELQYIDTKLQRADFLTKGLPAELFEANRLKVCGW